MTCTTCQCEAPQMREDGAGHPFCSYACYRTFWAQRPLRRWLRVMWTRGKLWWLLRKIPAEMSRRNAVAQQKRFDA